MKPIIALSFVFSASLGSTAAGAAETATTPTGQPASESASRPEAASSPATPPGAAALSATPPTPAAQPSRPPRALAVSEEGLFVPSLLLQGWVVYDHADENASTFRLRRAEIKAHGEILPGVSYGVMFDPAKVLEAEPKTVPVSSPNPPTWDQVTVLQPVSAISALQDLYITYQLDYADISVGQMKIPVSYEGSGSSAKLLFPERAAVSRTFGDKRDMGIRVGKRFHHFGYVAGVFNGAGANRLDFDNTKDLGLRLEVYPMDGVLLGAVAYGSLSLHGRPATGKERYEGDVRVAHGPFLVQAEYIRGRDAVHNDPTVRSQGFYVALAWSLFERLQAAARVGYFDPDLSQNLKADASAGDELWQLDATVNYYLRGDDAKLQLSYSRYQYDDRTPADEVILAAQVHY